MVKVLDVEWTAKEANGTERTENICMMLDAILRMKHDTLPKGIEGFRMMQRISSAFENKDKDGYMEFKDEDHAFLKKLLEENIPSVWGMSPKIAEAVETFLNPNKTKEVTT